MTVPLLLFFLLRLEKFTQDIEKEYQTFDAWRDKCDNMNQWLTESEKLIKSEEKVAGDIDALQEQIQDNQVGAIRPVIPENKYEENSPIKSM